MKHPVLSNSTRLIIWWLVWLFITAGQLLLYYYAYGSFTATSIPDGIISLAIYAGIGLSLWYPFRYFNATNSRNISVIGNLVLSGAISVTLWVLITRYLVLAVLPKENDYLAYWDVTFPYRVGTGVFIYGLIVLAY